MTISRQMAEDRQKCTAGGATIKRNVNFVKQNTIAGSGFRQLGLPPTHRVNTVHGPRSPAAHELRR